MAIGSFSLCRLLVSIAVVAVGCAALASPSSHWMCAVVSAKIIILFYAALAAVFRHGPPRAFWAGLAIVGWGYTFVTCGATLVSWDTTFYARPTDTRESPLITTRMLALLADKRKLYEDGNLKAAQTTNDRVSSNLGSNEENVGESFFPVVRLSEIGYKRKGGDTASPACAKCEMLWAKTTNGSM